MNTSLKKDFKKVRRTLSKEHAGFGFGFMWPKSALVSAAVYELFCRGFLVTPEIDHMVDSWASRALALGGAA